MMDNHVIDVALGQAPADLVIQNGTLVDVNTRTAYAADVAIAGNTVAAVGKLANGTIGAGTQLLDAGGKYLSPGFIDAHIHFESSMLTFTQFSRAVLPRGTTAVATDLMEIAIVAGMDGIREIFKEADALPLALLHTVPAFMSEEGEMQTIGAALYFEMIEELLQSPRAVGLAEVLYPPVLAKSPQSAQMLALADRLGKTAEGHAPALLNEKLSAFAGAGIRSDHESTHREEALEKARKGLRVLMREGSASQDLIDCLKIITKDNIDPRNCSMVSDDIDMLHIVQKGHLDHKVRLAVQAGVDPLVALQMVTINPAQSLKIDERYGSITPGKRADIVLLADLANCAVDSVVANGRLVVENGAMAVPFPSYPYAACMQHTVRLQKPVTASDLQLHVENAQEARVHVIGAHGKDLLTDKQEAILPVAAGVIQCDPARDILHIATVERYGKNGSIGRSFISGFGLARGAMATSVGHDHHNITALGADAGDMAVAINRIAELDGGLVIAEGGQVVLELPLPICGLLTTLSAEQSAPILDNMQQRLRQMGCTMDSPFMTLAFITLVFIPMLGITDRGLVDVLDFKVIDPVLQLL